MKQALGRGCQFFYSDSKNLQVGQRPLVQPRGRGEVIVLEKTDGRLSQGGEVVAIAEISRICLYFEDKEWGTYLQRMARSEVGCRDGGHMSRQTRLGMASDSGERMCPPNLSAVRPRWRSRVE